MKKIPELTMQRLNDDNGDDFCSHDENDIFEYGFGVAVADYDDFY